MITQMNNGNAVWRGMDEEEKILTGGGVNSWWLQTADGGWGKKCEAGLASTLTIGLTC